MREERRGEERRRGGERRGSWKGSSGMRRLRDQLVTDELEQLVTGEQLVGRAVGHGRAVTGEQLATTELDQLVEFDGLGHGTRGAKKPHVRHHVPGRETSWSWGARPVGHGRAVGRQGETSWSRMRDQLVTPDRKSLGAKKPRPCARPGCETSWSPGRETSWSRCQPGGRRPVGHGCETSWSWGASSWSGA
jgi:hypothetical protein